MAEEKLNQKPVWFARGLIVVLLILIPVVKFGGFEVSRSESDGVLVYIAPLFFSVFPLVMSGFALIAAVYFWSARRIHPVFRWMTLVFVMVSAYGVIMAPATLFSRLTLTPDTLQIRSGLWFRPTITELSFAKLDYLSVVEENPGQYSLMTYDGDGNETCIPIGDLLKAALPEVLERAGANDILIADGPDGWQIPSALMHSGKYQSL